MSTHWHALSEEEVRSRLGTSDEGLSAAQAAQRLEKDGPNELKAAKKRKAVYTPRAFYRFYRFLCRILPDALLIRLGRT